MDLIDFNDLLIENNLSPEQTWMCRKLRREAKNVKAAQKSRKGKMELIDKLKKNNRKETTQIPIMQS